MSPNPFVKGDRIRVAKTEQKGAVTWTHYFGRGRWLVGLILEDPHTGMVLLDTLDPDTLVRDTDFVAVPWESKS